MAAVRTGQTVSLTALGDAFPGRTKVGGMTFIGTGLNVGGTITVKDKGGATIWGVVAPAAGFSADMGNHQPFWIDGIGCAGTMTGTWELVIRIL